MKSSLKRLITIALILILGILSIARIICVNLEHHITETHTYKPGEKFKYNDLEVEVTEVNFYTADDMKKAYEEIPEEVLTDDEIVLRLEVENTTNKEMTFDISPFTLQVGLERGGSVDPYVYPYLNPGLSGTFTLKKDENQTVLLAFPIERMTLQNEEQIKLILSLYPEKYEIKI